MVTADMEMRIALIHELEAQKSELEAQIEALKDGVKAEMDAHRVSSMEVGGFSVHWTRYFQQRFDTKKFQAEHEDMYVEYTKPIPASRFTVSVKKEKEAK